MFFKLLFEQLIQNLAGHLGVSFAAHFAHHLADKPADEGVLAAAEAFHFGGVIVDDLLTDFTDGRVIANLSQPFGFNDLGW